MKTTHETAALSAANDNGPGGSEARVALHGLVTLMARAEARRFAEEAMPANTNAIPAKRNPQ